MTVDGERHDVTGQALLLPEVNREELLADGGLGLTRLFEQVRSPALRCRQAPAAR